MASQAQAATLFTLPPEQVQGIAQQLMHVMGAQATPPSPMPIVQAEQPSLSMLPEISHTPTLPAYGKRVRQGGYAAQAYGYGAHGYGAQAHVYGAVESTIFESPQYVPEPLLGDMPSEIKSLLDRAETAVSRFLPAREATQEDILKYELLLARVRCRMLERCFAVPVGTMMQDSAQFPEAAKAWESLFRKGGALFDVSNMVDLSKDVSRSVVSQLEVFKGDCIRCGRGGHNTRECFASTDSKGNALGKQQAGTANTARRNGGGGSRYQPYQFPNGMPQFGGQQQMGMLPFNQPPAPPQTGFQNNQFQNNQYQQKGGFRGQGNGPY